MSGRTRRGPTDALGIRRSGRRIDTWPGRFGPCTGDTGKVRQIPKLWDKKVAAFMTHAVNPGDAADKLSALLEGHGATVVAARSLNRRRLEDEAPAFATEVLASVGANA